MVLMKNAQLTLVTEQRSWQLSSTTRRVGIAGLRKARAALEPHLDPVEDESLAA